ncbi:3500_t:CDS:1, partial [Racocetra persica]
LTSLIVNINSDNQVENNNKHLLIETKVQDFDTININNDQVEDSDIFFNRLIEITQKILDLLHEHKDTKNLKWGKSIEKNFQSINTMVEQIETY